MTMKTSKRSAVERMVADAQAKVSWNRVVAKQNAQLPQNVRAQSGSTLTGWAKAIARVNARRR